MDLELPGRRELMRALPHGGVVVEVGVLRGDFSEIILAENAPRELYLVDVWAWMPNGMTEDHDKNYLIVKRKFVDNPHVHVIKSRSVPASWMFRTLSVDIVYIDADHKDAGRDIHAWWPTVKSGGWLTGHDYIDCGWSTVKTDVDSFVSQNNLKLIVTGVDSSTTASWAVQKP